MEAVYQVIGSDPDSITWWQMVCRAVLIFFYTLVLVRVAGRRIYVKTTTFEIILGVILGSIMSRALTANARFFPSLAAATAVIFLHRLLAELSRYSKALARIIKGTESLLVDNGKVQARELRRATMTEHDLMEALRSNGGTMTLEDVKAAYLERSGNISVVSH